MKQEQLSQIQNQYINKQIKMQQIIKFRNKKPIKVKLILLINNPFRKKIKYNLLKKLNNQKFKINQKKLLFSIHKRKIINQTK